jgi:hypothetical protein
MVHGPCDDINPASPCMVKGANGHLVCSKRFPKEFSEETQSLRMCILNTEEQ